MKVLFIGILTEEVLAQTRSEKLIGAFIDVGEAAKEVGRITGAFALNAKPQGCYWKGNWKRDLPEGAYMVLNAMAVAPEMQRQGTASEIIRFCINQAGSQGYRAIRVDIVPDNYPARRLFEKNGFTWAGDTDLELDIGNIPLFSLYKLNL